MEPATIATAIATIFLTKALEKTGEKFGEATLAKIGQAITHIRKHSPETATALVAGDAKVLNLGTAVLEQIQPDPIFAELVAAADAEENQELRQKLEEIKKTATQNPSKLAEKIGILVQPFGRVDIKEFKM
jgi:hypothetical protein